VVEEEVEDEEEHEEEEGMGGLQFGFDPTLQWKPPEEYVESDPELVPRARGPYQRGRATLPELPYADSGIVLVPEGKRYICFDPLTISPPLLKFSSHTY